MPEEVPLPPVPSGAGGAVPPRRSAGSGGGRDVEPPVKKTPIGKLILITLIGMGVLFGIGYGLGQFFRSDGSTTSSSDTGEPAPCVTVTVTPTALPPEQISVTVLNASAPPGSAASTADALGSVGFQIANVGNGTTDVTTAPAVIRFGPTSADAATTLQAYLAGTAELQESPDVTGLELILVGPFEGVADPAAAQAKLTAPTPSPSGSGCATPAAPAEGEAGEPSPTPAA